MNRELKPCPFCGSYTAPTCMDANEIKLIDKDDPDYSRKPYYAVCCSFSEEGCGATGGHRNTPLKAIDAWNRRCAK